MYVGELLEAYSCSVRGYIFVVSLDGPKGSTLIFEGVVNVGKSKLASDARVYVFAAAVVHVFDIGSSVEYR